MKLIKTLPKFNLQKLPTFNPNNWLAPTILGLATILIWTVGPKITFGHSLPLASPEKRLYATLVLFLVWILKYLLFDFAESNHLQVNDKQVEQQLLSFKKRFLDLLQFLKKTNVNTAGEQLNLNKLPWYLLVGPKGSGKTALLANSHVNFILQHQLQLPHLPSLTASEDCEWWITRNLSIIDVPSKFLNPDSHPKKNEPALASSGIWSFMLDLIREYRGKEAMEGVIIALPLPELMEQSDLKKYQNTLKLIFTRLAELAKKFPRSLPCYLIITKCDLLNGFTEFFAESSNSEVAQAWGVLLQQLKAHETLPDLFTKRFNALIKKLNQQLLWRLHQERNHLSRSAIKEFPLQIERLKEFTLDFVKKFAAQQSTLHLQGVYLTSALQNPPLETTKTLENLNLKDETRETPLPSTPFKEPFLLSRPYFIKQLINYGLTIQENDVTQQKREPAKQTWLRRGAYATSFIAIGATAVILGQDFERGIKHAYAIQNNLADYQLTLKQPLDFETHLNETLRLLNKLQQSAKNDDHQIDLSYFFSFYSHKSLQKASVVYRQALRTLLIPEIKNYLEEYLKIPANQNEEYTYAALKAYLMLGDEAHLEPTFISNMLKEILPKSMSEQEIAELVQHTQVAFSNKWHALTLDNNIINQARRFLNAKSSTQLGYIILKNINSNNTESTVNLGTHHHLTVLTTPQISNQIPLMFTAKIFPAVSEESNLAAKEAVLGNWVLGDNHPATDHSNALIEPLRNMYISHYVDAWESLLANIKLSQPKNLQQTNLLIGELINNNSPLLQLLQTIHENTFFNPIMNNSPKLLGLNMLLEKNNKNENTLYQIFASLQSLHEYLRAVLSAPDEKKAAFEAVAHHISLGSATDPILQVRMMAEKSPEPIKNWMEQISNHAWHFLLEDASHYIDTSWQHQVHPLYQDAIAHYYPFDKNSKKTLDVQQFTQFFGNPGVVTNFYQHYLAAFIDTAGPAWRAKTIDNDSLPFSEETLIQLQLAMQINRAFFPNGDNKLELPFNQNNLADIYHASNKPHKISGKNVNPFLSLNLEHFHLPEQLF